MNGLIFATEATSEGGILSTEITIVILLTVAALVAILAKRLNAPFTVALVLVGLGLSFTNSFIEVSLSKDLILGVLVPPLIFEATMHLPWRRLKTDLASILTLAIGGTLIGTFLVGALIRPFVEVPMACCPRVRCTDLGYGSGCRHSPVPLFGGQQEVDNIGRGRKSLQ